MENWKDIEGYEGMYQVSDLGRIRSLDRYVRNGKPMCIKKGRVLKLHNHGSGYFRVSLCRDNSERFTMFHRIVANAFILTTVAFGGLSVFAMNTKRDFTTMGKMLFIRLWTS